MTAATSTGAPLFAQPTRDDDTSSASGVVRPFRRADIPSVAALRRPAFRDSERQSPAALESYLERIFFGGPRRTGDLPSYVYEYEGQVSGFLGVIPRMMQLRGRPVRVAVATQLMSAPQNRGSAGRRMVRALFDGPQDLTIADIGNDAARIIHESLGGRTAVAYSLTWRHDIRPARAFLAQRAASTSGRLLSHLLRPACAVVDGALNRTPSRAKSAGEGDRVTAMQMPLQLAELDGLLDRWSLRPVYDRESLLWVLAALREKKGCDDVQQCLVRDGRHRVVGWFLYCRNAGGTSEVVQLAARKGAADRVIAQLFNHAWVHGSVALTGRLDPEMVAPLARAGCGFAHHGNWMLVHSRDDEVLAAVERNDAFISRLDGEWWLSF